MWGLFIIYCREWDNISKLSLLCFRGAAIDSTFTICLFKNPIRLIAIGSGNLNLCNLAYLAQTNDYPVHCLDAQYEQHARVDCNIPPSPCYVIFLLASSYAIKLGERVMILLGTSPPTMILFPHASVLNVLVPATARIEYETLRIYSMPLGYVERFLAA